MSEYLDPYLDPKRSKLVAALEAARFTEEMTFTAGHPLRYRVMIKGRVKVEVGMVEDSRVYIYLLDGNGEELMECDCRGMNNVMITSIVSHFEIADN